VNTSAPAIAIPAARPQQAPWVNSGMLNSGMLNPEMLSSEIQSTLVPPITYAGARLQAHGQSMPKDDVGGDLVDLVADGRDVIAYVADVSGHGLRAGVLMGMIKTAMRYGLLLGQPLTKLLDDLNCVLPGVKQPNMFATLAALRFDGSSHLEYISAGHVPLLHYRQRTGEVVRHSMSQFPLGLLAGEGYVSRHVRYEAGDIFALVTDGVVEVGEEQDADLGCERLAQMLCDLAERPLSDIAEGMHTEVRRHGTQRDDQTILLVRAVAEGVAQNDAGRQDLVPNQPEARAEALETRWRMLLDDLAAELASD